MSIRDVNNDAKWHKEKALQIIQEAIDTSAESISFDGLTKLEAIPHEILKLPNLKHLTCRHCFRLDYIDIILNLTELETLIFDDIRNEYATFLPQLSQLKNLRTLHIDSFNFDNENLLNQLISLEKLEDFHTYSQETSALWNMNLKEGEERHDDLLQNYHFPSLFKKLHNLKSFSFTLCEYHINNVLNVLIDMPNLRRLKICAHGVPTLLSKLTQIEELDFTEWEDLAKLPDDIGNLQNLKKLVLAPDIDTMNIGELPDAFYSLTKLEELELFSCKNITYLKDEFKNFKNLHSLYTIASSIYTVPFSHEQLKNLKKLGLQGELLDFSLCKNLTSFYYYASQVGWNSIKGSYGTERNYNFQNTNIEQLSKLENIRLLRGRLTDTSFLSSLINIKNIKIQSDIENLPEDIGNLTKLEEMKLEYAESLKCLPESFGDLQSLRTLTIEDTQLESIPKSMPKLHSLKELTFENVSKLKTIPKELYLLPNLEKLRVINCPDLEEIEDGISLLNKLVFLDIERNPKLKKLPSDIDSFGRDIFGLVSWV